MKKRLFILSLLILVSGSSYALTSADIISQARVYLKDTATARQNFSDATLLSFENEGQREANAIAWLLQSTYTFSLVAGTTEYYLPSDFMATNSVLVNKLKIDQTSLNQLDTESSGWRNVSGKPNKYYVYYSSTPIIGFEPAPISGSTGTVTVYYVQQPTEITATTQVPWNGYTMLYPYHSALIDYVTYRAFLTLEETDLASLYYQTWISFLQTVRQGMNKMPDFNPGFQGRRTDTPQ